MLTEKGKKSSEIWNTFLRHNEKQKKMITKKKKKSARYTTTSSMNESAFN